jgi:hypothetical protein
MSDMTGLSHEYATTAEFAQQVNQAVLVLKKDRLREIVPPESEEDLAQARAALREVVSALLALVSQAEASVSAAATETMIPEDVIARLKRKYQSRMVYFLADLRRTLSALDGEIDLSDDEIAVLDSVCDAADASASASFRRLRRR